MPWPPIQCYQMELRWRFRDLIKCFKNEKKCFDMQFAFILNGFVPKNEQVTKQSFQIWTNYMTLGFAENSQFTIKKGIEKLS